MRTNPAPQAALVVHDARQEPLLQMRRPAGHSLSALQRCSPQYRPKSPDWQPEVVARYTAELPKTRSRKY